jgi:uncharacterized protein YggE
LLGRAGLRHLAGARGRAAVTAARRQNFDVDPLSARRLSCVTPGMKPLSSLLQTLGRRALAGALFASAPAVVGCTPQVTVLSGSAASPEFHTITVVGQGEATAKPDLAMATFGVEVLAPKVADASAQAAARMNQILATFKRSGIAEKDIQTSNFSVTREQQPEDIAPPPVAAPAGPAPKGAPAPTIVPPPYPAPQRLVEVYRVSNTVAVKIRDLKQVGAVLDAAIAAGANNIHGIQFALDNPDALEAQAREKAAADARSKAEALAKLQGVSLAGVVSIDETPGDGMPVPFAPRAAMWAAKGMAESGTPASPGEVSLSAQVQVVYALKGAGASAAK